MGESHIPGQMVQCFTLDGKLFRIHLGGIEHVSPGVLDFQFLDQARLGQQMFDAALHLRRVLAVPRQGVHVDELEVQQ